ncbi:MAG: ABC transporter ATP-binding protein [Candidatus Thermofonsia Clade 1 bacterium]|jgi:NitT/TauT family transport system ATP-binding protein|uniref:ABC transporter ATP-binding protein n=1 Tax=Candidatus Thermofonsia Clade 1 bacterium TaxID=2364210 RepID=A0A2M8PGU8_9CHLR|nr:MAG: ABC transporter ATP-binding protein [Candidatus Thermofonsia Clade 1 bacterium]RMF51876.1 MAG: ABC transporter ATP-binding protein [Chloroflexota bacterium]
MLKFESVWQRFGALEVLQNISFELTAGEFVCLVGPSGCGKTTLLRIGAGLLKASAGRVLLKAEPITAPRPEIGILFQQPNLLPYLSTRANIELPLALRGVPRAERRSLAQNALAQLGLAEFAEAYPSQLSGGMAQRAALGRALMQNPSVLLMDEPFGALDALTREQMQLELLDIWQRTGKTILMVTHSITEAIFMADRVLVLTARPSKLSATLCVPLPRPRRLEMIHSAEFGALAAQLRSYIGMSSA